MTSADDIKRIIDRLDFITTNIYESFNLLPVQDYSKKVLKVTEGIPDYSSLIRDAIKPLQALETSAETIIQNLEQSATIMFENGWWLIPTMPSSFYFQLGGEEDITQQNLTDFLINYHNKDDCNRLENLMNRWNLDEFKDNQEIFEDSLWAHKQSKYTLTVPALTIQVEGIIRSYLDHISKFNFSGYREELKNKYDEAMQNEKKDLGFEKFMELQNINFLKKRMDSLYGTFDPSKPGELNDLNRHALFHGRYKNYNTIEISTKLFLFLDMIHHILSDLEKFKQKN